MVHFIMILAKHITLNANSKEMVPMWDDSCYMCRFRGRKMLFKCDTTTGIGLTPAYYEGINAGGNTCSANSELTASVEKLDAYTGYAIADCLSVITKTKCFVNAGGDGCEAYDDATSDPCPTVKLFKQEQQQFHILMAFVNYMIARLKQINLVVKPSLHLLLQLQPVLVILVYLLIRLAQASSVLAQQMQLRLLVSPQKILAQILLLGSVHMQKKKKKCLVSGTSFVQKNCDSAASTVTTLAGCQAGSTNCVIRVGGCQFRANCASYKVQGTCVKNACGLLQQLNLLIKVVVQPKHQLVLIVILNVQPLENVQSKQLQTRQFLCTIEEQCKKNTKDKDCVWNTNADPVTCADILCATAPITSYSDHDGCREYLVGCTVNVIDVNGTPTLQGCVAYKTCNSYTHEGQCKISSDKDNTGANIVCGWNGTTCAIKSCLTAQGTVNTPTFLWIIQLVVLLMQQIKVVLLFQMSVKCITKKCENSLNYGSESECDTYLSGCTTDAIKCKTKICEDFSLSTDALCKAGLSICTSNGVNCVKIGTYSQALAEAGCVTDSNLKQCQWMTLTGQDAYCTNKSCTTAPTSLTTEAQCVAYFTPSVGICTTKKDGGCTLKGACTSANVATACTTDNNKNECQWDTEANNCRLKECQDFAGTTHAACQKQRTVMQEFRLKHCGATNIKGGCKTGTDDNVSKQYPLKEPQTLFARSLPHVLILSTQPMMNVFQLIQIVHQINQLDVFRWLIAQQIPKTNVSETRMENKKMLMEVLHHLVLRLG
ncbi:unnamed protein product [Paramecium octaurelia]|uniref:Uncharacterized protein n=1 Tax=Paramecium octaurelia TaxID=43137 RepID=A0A8S1YRT3_PAROT|nr:unnamed protein product [Paramecium octaurelia]